MCSRWIGAGTSQSSASPLISLAASGLKATRAYLALSSRKSASGCSPHIAAQSSRMLASSWPPGRGRAAVLETSSFLFRMSSKSCASCLFFLLCALGAQCGERWSSIWSLKDRAISARSLSVSPEKIRSDRPQPPTRTSSSCLSTPWCMAESISWICACAPHRGDSILSMRAVRSMASQARDSNFLGITDHSRANWPKPLRPLGAPTRSHSEKSVCNIRGSEKVPLSHQRRAAKERSSFETYSFWSLRTRSEGALKGSAAVRPAAMAIASQGQRKRQPM
mmetsp:Transcript_4907/g.14471  ORF Transcript_4907/g.14471 Transcript_4907/m.14471 type:complete len:279 (+) Transcript_4907:1265-2101(+)